MWEELKERYYILKIALSCWFKGDPWPDSVWYAESIVKGWKKEKK